MKKLHKIIGLAIASFTLCCVATFAACKDDKKSIKGISVETGEEPRLTYVQGQALDFAGGQLTIIKDGKGGNESISLSDEKVTVSGYDANLLGNQTITITYGKFSTTLEVKVLARMAVTGYKVDYMVGETFSTKGTVTIANDDGTTKTFPLNDPAITVEGFISEEVATVPVTVTYTAGEVTYTATYSVNVKAAEEAQIILPDKRVQYSHEEKLDLSGGQIILTFGGRPTAITINESMVSGYDPSKATVANRTEPLKQTITVSYGGHEKTYEIKIYFSGVSLMKLRASEFEDLVYDKENNVVDINDTYGAQALDAMLEYYKLTNSEKALISLEEKEKVVRHAVAYGNKVLQEAAAKLTKTFEVSGGYFYWKADGTQTDAKFAYDTLCDENSDFVKYGTLLYKVQQEFKDSMYVEDAIVGDNLYYVYSDDELTFAQDILSYLLGLHDQLAEVVPLNKDWTKEDLATTETTAAILSVVGKIMNGKYNGYDYIPIYQMLSSWRDKDDFFDILYAHYYYGGDTKKEMILGKKENGNVVVEPMFQSVPLPTLLQNLYVAIVEGYFQADTMSSNPNDTIWYDTLDLFMAKKNIEKAQEEIQQKGSEFVKELGEYIGLDAFIFVNYTDVEKGYLDQTQEAFGDKAFETLWESYLAIFDLMDEDGQLQMDAPEVTTALAALFKSFVEAAPSTQYSFIASMHNRYRELDRYTKENTLVLDFSDDQVESTFVYLCATYFIGEFSYEEGEEVKEYEKAQGITEELFKAIELYFLRDRYDTMEDFQYIMGKVNTAYKGLTGAEKTKFDEIFGYAYEKYIALWEKSTSTTATNWGEFSSTVEEMKKVLAVGFSMEKLINNSATPIEEKGSCYPVLLAAYEKAAALAATITATLDKNLLYSYYYDEFVISDKLTSSLDYALWKLRATYIRVLTSKEYVTVTVTSDLGGSYTSYGWYYYDGSSLQTLLGELYNVLVPFKANGTFDNAKVVAAMQAMCGADADTLSDFYNFRVEKVYYDGLISYFQGFTEAKDLALKLIDVEKAYHEYVRAKEEEKAEKLTAFQTAIDEAKALQEGVASTAEYTNSLQATYEFYLAKAMELGA